MLFRSTLSRLLLPLHLQNRRAHTCPAPNARANRPSSSSLLLRPRRRRSSDRLFASSSSPQVRPASPPGSYSLELSTVCLAVFEPSVQWNASPPRRFWLWLIVSLCFACVADGCACRCPGRLRGRVRGDPRSPGTARPLACIFAWRSCSVW